MKIRIQGGTARHDEPSLCLGCKTAQIVRGQTSRDEIIVCSSLRQRIEFKVTSCSEYLQRGHASLWHMEDVAWILRTDIKRRQVGFVRSRDLPEDDRHLLEE